MTGRGKKGPKRPARGVKHTHDDELAELASVISEYALDNNAGGWFRPPWRDGWNAVALGAACTKALTARPEEVTWLRTVCEQRIASAETYWRASEMLQGAGEYSDKMFHAALRCLQVLVANSDGGGHVYNAILVQPFYERLPEDVFDAVLEARCRDSIGTTAVMCGDINDRQRRAFSIAWKRGLYVAAYALPPAIDSNVGKLTILKDIRNG